MNDLFTAGPEDDGAFKDILTTPINPQKQMPNSANIVQSSSLLKKLKLHLNFYLK